MLCPEQQIQTTPTGHGQEPEAVRNVRRHIDELDLTSVQTAVGAAEREETSRLEIGRGRDVVEPGDPERKQGRAELVVVQQRLPHGRRAGRGDR